MDVFALREKVVGEYRNYIKSFVRIRDEQINDFVEEEFAKGTLWPDAILQLNPAYAEAPTLHELSEQGVVFEKTADFFRVSKNDGLKPLKLYQHQLDALEIANRGEPYVVTTGTGSGKSMAYMIPIVDHILRNEPAKRRVRAIIVYPMNALINSQADALKRWKENNPGSLVSYATYTGPTDEVARQQILDNPPHILLTNYMMLEYLLLRPRERHLVSRMTGDLKFLVLDELHTYRGRQGADVAMLMRRLRERSGNPDLLNIGTSATIATGGKRDDRRKAAADIATKIFGTVIKPGNVVDETLRRAITAAAPGNGASMKAAVEGRLPAEIPAAFAGSPLAAWMENTFGLDNEDGRLVRRKPIKFADGVELLAKESGLDRHICEERLRQYLTLGNQLRNDSGEPVFAFRLHQFLAAGGTVYASLEKADSRHLTLEGQHYAPSKDGERLLYPLVFCRECGQEYYMVSWNGGETGKVLPRLPFLTNPDEDDETGKVRPGYMALAEEGFWSREHEDELPDHWFEGQAGRERLKRDYRQHVPELLRVDEAGVVGGANVAEAWFQPIPFLLCQRCGAAYDRTERNEFKKLSRLSNTGRSTSTTIVSAAAIVQLREDQNVEKAAEKLMSFTDNRQDASLQAGHFNDFIQVALIRAALFGSLEERKTLDHANITPAVFKTLGLDQKQYAKESASWGAGKVRNEQAFQRLLEYRLYEDLRRGWRVAQPNLEQCGLLSVDYAGLKEMCAAPEPWTIHPLLQQVSPERRLELIKAFLEYLRREMALDAKPLDRDEQFELRRRVQQNLRDPWGMDDNDQFLESAVFVFPGQPANTRRERSLGTRSKLARFLRRRDLWGLKSDLNAEDGEKLIRALIEALRGNYLTLVRTEDGREGIQLLTGCLQWKLGDGTPPPPDEVRSKWMRSARLERVEREANRFFEKLYRETARRLVGVEGGAHTGQIPAKLRQDREHSFGSGDLAALFCSPTMELGVDIRDLNVVHMRNIPPTPANYAQRSGRAGRGGQPALVMAFCSEGSQHDQYFFRRPGDMVSGAVAPARLELGNEELVKSHLHSAWLAATGVALKSRMQEVLHLGIDGFPLNDDIQQGVNLSEERYRELEEECRHILDACGNEIRKAPWNTDGWLARTLRRAHIDFNEAFQRWRDLYKSALRQRDEARAQVDRPTASRKEREEAERREDEAKREISLLRNESDEVFESDFYPYRYLASEGFLPGYNFPRLPLRALVPTADGFHVIDRPRFLALAEFGPRNVIYHEGRKYRMAKCILPAGGIEARLSTAKFCNECGYFHDGENAKADRCDHCGSMMDGANSQFVSSLFEMGTTRGYRADRITCDEEERVREGFEIETHFRFMQGPDGKAVSDLAVAKAEDGVELLRLTSAPQADLWRVNQRWRRSQQNGFTLDGKTGYWARRPGDDDNAPTPDGRDIRPGIRPFVRDTRNILLLQPVLKDRRPDDSFLSGLAYALQRGMQLHFQVEQQEIQVERIGGVSQRRLLFWEAAEGGNGIWPRLFEDPSMVARLAAQALSICHFDPATGKQLPGWEQRCSHACYECLLSYSNQLEHPQLNRHTIKEYLLALSCARTELIGLERTREEQYAWLEERIDQSSTLESDFLKLLHKTKRRLPDRAQYRPVDGVYAEADFYYERQGLPGVCVFCDGPHHDNLDRKAADEREREKLENLGYRAILIRYDRPMEDQLATYADVFGVGIANGAASPVQGDPK